MMKKTETSSFMIYTARHIVWEWSRQAG